MLLQTSIYSSILKITASNFQEMPLSDFTLQRHHELDFDEHNHKVPFVVSWPIYMYINNLNVNSEVFIQGLPSSFPA